ncbi:unnamed protein product [Penicillium nalgiovense]|nr:unnamed protein product [Penicillium nalgiovense]
MANSRQLMICDELPSWAFACPRLVRARTPCKITILASRLNLPMHSLLAMCRSITPGLNSTALTFRARRNHLAAYYAAYYALVLKVKTTRQQLQFLE